MCVCVCAWPSDESRCLTTIREAKCVCERVCLLASKCMFFCCGGECVQALWNILLFFGRAAWQTWLAVRFGSNIIVAWSRSRGMWWRHSGDVDDMVCVPFFLGVTSFENVYNMRYFNCTARDTKDPRSDEPPGRLASTLCGTHANVGIAELCVRGACEPFEYLMAYSRRAL